ncbi:MAG TPA: acetate--CoA ligase family protein [Steroidobacteraceae bacterium]
MKRDTRGLELLVGARRDATWGPILMVGMGGIWVEVLGDVRLMPLGLSSHEIIAEMMQLRSSKLLTGFRGAPPVDLKAVAEVVQRLGNLMESRPEITEVDINPLIAYSDGACALDALIVTEYYAYV